MSPWASRRKNIILGAIALILTAVVFFGFWRYWYATPSCFDNLKNGDEAGVDCGGACVLVCSGDALSPIIKWDPRLFEVSPGVWSILVYVENPNIDTEATYAPYTFTIYDDAGSVLETRKGVTILPKNKTVGIFEGNITFAQKNKPKRATFEFDQGLIWNKNTELVPDINITHSALLKLESAPRVEANVKNISAKEIKNIELVAAIFDGSDNAIATSRTFVEKLKKDQGVDVFFTWPKPFELGSKVCEKNSDIMLLLDRSGSMASLGNKPPQPLNDAKLAADFFVSQLRPRDKVGLISFANSIKEPIDLSLSTDQNLIKKAIENVNIEASSTQYTNIYAALHGSWQELVSARSTPDNSKITILLTDGVANNPKNPNGKTENDDIKYAEDLALKEAQEMKNNEVAIYTIGLGDKINEIFLQTIASNKESYFFAPTAADLENIYKNISFDICKEVPARIEITYKIFGDAL